VDTLVADLCAFLSEHEDCPTEMDGGVEDRANGAAVVWFACQRCGVRIVRDA